MAEATAVVHKGFWSLFECFVCVLLWLLSFRPPCDGVVLYSEVGGERSSQQQHLTNVEFHSVSPGVFFFCSSFKCFFLYGQQSVGIF